MDDKMNPKRDANQTKDTLSSDEGDTDVVPSSTDTLAKEDKAFIADTAEKEDNDVPPTSIEEGKDEDDNDPKEEQNLRVWINMLTKREFSREGLSTLSSSFWIC